MGLIEIPNVNSGMTVRTAGRGRFVVVGEPTVAVDLVNTVAVPGSATGEDLLSADGGAEAWWRIEAARVPGGDLPDIGASRRLRSALRDLIEALVDDRPVPQEMVSDLNFFMRSAAASCAAVRGLPVRNVGCGSTTPRCAANWSSHNAFPLSGS